MVKLRIALAVVLVVRANGARPSLGRRAAIGAAACFPAAASWASLPPSLLPLQSVAGGLACTYSVDGAPFRGIVDTGSPFLLVDGTCASGGRWGCYPPGGLSAARGHQGSLDDASIENFAGQVTRVEWRRGLVDVGGRGRLRVEPAVFGALRDFRGRGGAGGVYLGLVKHRSARVRPTFLEQVGAEALRFDLRDARRRTLEIATRGPLISAGDDAVPMVDLRPLGAPIEPYAVAVAGLSVNGVRVALDRPTVAVVDTGTTGLTIADTLLGSPALPVAGAAVRTAEVIVATERGKRLALAATARAGAEFPLITTPCALPWFAGRESSAPHVLFLGLAFLATTRLTIDVETRRLRLG